MEQEGMTDSDEGWELLYDRWKPDGLAIYRNKDGEYELHWNQWYHAPKEIKVPVDKQAVELYLSGERTGSELIDYTRYGVWPGKLTEAEEKEYDRQFLLSNLDLLVSIPKNQENFTAEELEELMPLARKKYEEFQKEPEDGTLRDRIIDKAMNEADIPTPGFYTTIIRYHQEMIDLAADYTDGQTQKLFIYYHYSADETNEEKTLFDFFYQTNGHLPQRPKNKAPLETGKTIVENLYHRAKRYKQALPEDTFLTYDQ